MYNAAFVVTTPLFPIIGSAVKFLGTREEEEKEYVQAVQINGSVLEADAQDPRPVPGEEICHPTNAQSDIRGNLISSLPSSPKCCRSGAATVWIRYCVHGNGSCLFSNNEYTEINMAGLQLDKCNWIFMSHETGDEGRNFLEKRGRIFSIQKKKTPA